MTKRKSESRRGSHLAYALVVILMAALSTMAVLQYRWIGAVATAERQRMQNSVQLATSRFSEEFNGEVARALISLIRVQDSFFPDTYGELFFQWAATSAYPQMVRSVFVADSSGHEQVRLSRLNTKTRMLEICDWPDRLLEVKESFGRDFFDAGSIRPRRGLPFLSTDPPTVVAPLARLFTRPVSSLSSFPPIPPFIAGPHGWVIVEFDQERIVNEVFPAFVARYFSALGVDEFHVQVLARGEPRTVIYQSDPSAPAQQFGVADSIADLFEFGPGSFVPRPEPPGPGLGFRGEVFSLIAGENAGHWQVLVEHRLGSLDAAANRLRLRNLTVSFGVLLVLVGAVALMIVTSERERTLARRQMQFAAAVSHEMRTPLAAIQALTHNLSIGIIKDPSHICEYARMVHDEARGLSSIVDQILLFAETRSIQKKYSVSAVEVVEVVDHALSSLTSQVRGSGCEIVTDISVDLPPVRANAVSLAHCVRNLVSNATTYATGRIEITATAMARVVRVNVIDHG